MAEITPLTRLVCDGCRKNYDNQNDLAPARVGTQELQLCRRCFVTVLGIQPPLVTFETAKELAGQPVIEAPGPVVVQPMAAAEPATATHTHAHTHRR